MNIGWIFGAVAALACIFLIANHDQGTVLGLQNERFAQLIYLSIFAVFILGGILPRKGELRTFVRNAITWLAVILVLMTGYLYRYELQDFGSAVTGGLIAGSPISSKSSQGRNQVTIFRSDNGHFMINGEANRESVRFLVDTGASSIVLSDIDARAIGIDTSQLNFNIPVSTANGVTTSARARLDTLRFGEIFREDVPVMVARPGNLDESLLGMRFIDSLWGFEIRGDRMIFTD